MWLEFLSITYPIKKITSVYIIDAKFKFKSVGKMYPWIKWTFFNHCKQWFHSSLKPDGAQLSFISYNLHAHFIQNNRLIQTCTMYTCGFIYGNEYDSPITRDSIVSHFFFLFKFLLIRLFKLENPSGDQYLVLVSFPN